MAAGLDPSSDAAREWLMNRAREIFKIVPSGGILRDPDRYVNDTHKLLPGRMYLFYYNALGKDELPYWDKLPLVFPVQKYKDGFLGINFHYLAPHLRYILFDQLLKFRNNNKYDETTRLKLSYQLISTFAKSHVAKPTLHRYLYTQFKSRILWIQPTDWEVCLSLPCEAFVGKLKQGVWKESRKIILS